MWKELFFACAIFAVGSVVFGHFERGLPVWRRLLKWALFLALTAAITALLGSAWALSFLAFASLAGLTFHFAWCRKHAIDPWRAEPWGEYARLRGWQ